MENGNSPRLDGLIKCYKEFFEITKDDPQITFDKALFDLKLTPKTWNQAIITLIPEKENLKLLKYCRPISLLCTYFKIFTKILANRLKQILPEIVSKEQNCSVPDRPIFNNLLLVRDIIR